VSIDPEKHPDSLIYWIQKYRELAVDSVRSEAVGKKITLHLDRFLNFFRETYGHDRISTYLHRDALAWQTTLSKQYAASTVNNHMASVSGFTTWVQTHDPSLFPAGDPMWGSGREAAMRCDSEDPDHTYKLQRS